jgi:hypothetical protein
MRKGRSKTMKKFTEHDFTDAHNAFKQKFGQAVIPETFWLHVKQYAAWGGTMRCTLLDCFLRVEGSITDSNSIIVSGAGNRMTWVRSPEEDALDKVTNEQAFCHTCGVAVLQDAESCNNCWGVESRLDDYLRSDKARALVTDRIENINKQKFEKHHYIVTMDSMDEVDHMGIINFIMKALTAYAIAAGYGQWSSKVREVSALIPSNVPALLEALPNDVVVAIIKGAHDQEGVDDA